MMRYAILLMLLVVCGSANAQQSGTATLTWTNPIQNTDQSEIPANDHGSLAYTTIHYSTCVAGDVDIPNAKKHYVSANKTTTTVSTEGPPDEYCFRATATNSFGVASELSGLAVKTVTLAGQARAPVQPMTLATLTVADPTVYTIIRQENKFVLLPVGTVPSNTTCDPSQKINDHYVVPRDQVTWSGTVKPAVVVASCS